MNWDQRSLTKLGKHPQIIIPPMPSIIVGRLFSVGDIHQADGDFLRYVLCTTLRAAGLGNQRIIRGSYHRKNIPGCLFKLLCVCLSLLRWGSSEYSRQHSFVYISHFSGYADCRHITTINVYIPLLNHISHSQFWVIKTARCYLLWILHASDEFFISSKIFNGGENDVYQVLGYQDLRRFLNTHL